MPDRGRSGEIFFYLIKIRQTNANGAGKLKGQNFMAAVETLQIAKLKSSLI